MSLCSVPCFMFCLCTHVIYYYCFVVILDEHLLQNRDTVSLAYTTTTSALSIGELLSQFLLECAQFVILWPFPGPGTYMYTTPIGKLFFMVQNVWALSLLSF